MLDSLHPASGQGWRIFDPLVLIVLKKAIIKTKIWNLEVFIDMNLGFEDLLSQVEVLIKNLRGYV